MAESEIIFAVEESPEGGYEARALGYSIYTQADTIEELKGMVQDAVRCHFGEEAGPRVAILADVASYLDMDRRRLIEDIFGE